MRFKQRKSFSVQLCSERGIISQMGDMRPKTGLQEGRPFFKSPNIYHDGGLYEKIKEACNMACGSCDVF